MNTIDCALQNNGLLQTHILNTNDVRYNERWLLTSHMIVALNKLYNIFDKNYSYYCIALIRNLATQMRNLLWVAMRCYVKVIKR